MRNLKNLIPMQLAKSHVSFLARLTVFTIAAAVALSAMAQDKSKDPQASYDPRSAPGAGQKFLEKFVGDWDVQKVFHPRTGDPVITKGECHQEMINDGRFLKSDFVFPDAQGKITGVGLIGFEPATGLFTSVWADSRATKMSIRQSRDPFDGKQIVMSSLPVGGGVREARPSRNVTHLEDNGRKIVHQQYAINPDNSERVMLELILTKKEGVELLQPPDHGASFLLQVDAAAGDTNILSQIQSAMEIRFAALGVKIFWEPVSATQARIFVPITDERKIEDAKDCIVRRGVLELRLVHTNSDDLVLRGSGESGYEQVQFPHKTMDGREVSGFLVEKKPQLTGKYVIAAFVTRNAEGRQEIEFSLNPEGSSIFAKVTGENLGRQLAIVVDGELQSAPVIRSPIEGGAAIISGQFTEEKAVKLANALRCFLPAPVKLIESKTF